jgi:phospholipid/cholesterol/gamma-HCH transport system substrate-binding protein
LHNVDRILVGNQALVKDALLSFETYTASLASKGEAIESIMGKADNAFVAIDTAMSRIDNVIPGLANGKPDDLFEKVKSIRELAESFDKKSGAVMEEGRRSLLDVSEAAIKLSRKFDPQPATADSPPPSRRASPKRQ